MKATMIKPIITGLTTLLIFCWGQTVFSAIALNTEVVSGKVYSIQDKVIDLEGGGKYYPAPSMQVEKISAGDLVSIRYFLNNEDKNIYIEVEKGLNSIVNKPRSTNKAGQEY